MTVRHLNPDQLFKNPAFTQVVSISGPVRTVYVGGQNAVSASGEIIGKGALAAQAEQVLQNLQTALPAADGDVEHLIEWTIHVVDGQSLQPAFAAFRRFWGNRPNPPLITLTRVSDLANPDFLVEIDALAAVPE